MDKSTVLTSIKPINRNMKIVAKITLKFLAQNIPSSVKVGSFFAP
jgi:hypothetical protein